METAEIARKIAGKFNAAVAEVEKVVVGQTELIEAVMVSLFAEGNVLIEGVPGLGKTLLVTTLSRVLSCDSKRIQFTPDLMPSDVTGTSVYNLKDQEFHFNAGPIFTNLLLADEINRAPAKTQSALLEAMQEHQVSVDGTTHKLSQPFITIATQNPIEQEGTYPLPEAQLDRFMFKLLIDYPAANEEIGILKIYASGRDNRRQDQFNIQPILTADEIKTIQKAISRIITEDSILEYIHKIIHTTRNWPAVEIGASPRAGVNLLLASRAMAACRGRDFVIPDDVKTLAPWVLRHRLRLNPDAEIEGIEPDQVVFDILENVEAPRT